MPPFDDEAGAVALANDSPFGLAGAVWTATFWINSYKTIGVMSPFGASSE